MLDRKKRHETYYGVNQHVDGFFGYLALLMYQKYIPFDMNMEDDYMC
jgi:hypothetical protein